MGIGWIGAAITIPLGFGLPAVILSTVAADIVGMILAPDHYREEARERQERQRRIDKEWEESEKREAERRRLSGEAARDAAAALRQNHEIYWRARNEEWRDYVDSHRRPV